MRDAILGLALGLLAGCSPMVVGGPGEGGGGAGVGSGGAGPGGAGPGGADPSTSSGAFGSACSNYCGVQAAHHCGDTAPPCSTWCPEVISYSGVCGKQEADLLDCYAVQQWECQAPSPSTCASFKKAFDACAYPAGACTHLTCKAGPDGTEVCTNACGGVKYTSACDTGSFSCTCSVDGAMVGSCSDFRPFGACCVQFFAGS